MGWVAADRAWNWGVGILTLDGSTRSSAVSISAPSAEGLDQTVKIFLAESRQEVYSALAITAETQGSYGLSNASVTFELAEAVTETGYDLYLVMAATAYFPAATADATLTAAALAPLQSGEYFDFLRQYGDQFVFGMQAGGIYAGILEIHAQSSDVLWGVKTGLGVTASGTLVSAQVEAAVETTLKQYQGFVQTQVAERALGGKPQPDSVTVEDMMRTALGFPSTVTQKNAWPMYADIRSYTELNVPNAAALAEFLSALEGPSQTLVQRRNDVVALQDRLTSATFAYEHPEGFAADADTVRGLVGPELNTLPSLVSSIGQGTSSYVKSLTAAINRNQSVSNVQSPPSYTMPDPVILPGSQPGAAYVIRSKSGFVLAPGLVQPPTLNKYAGVVTATINPLDVSQRWMVTGTVPTSGEGDLEMVNGATKLPLQYFLTPNSSFWPAAAITSGTAVNNPDWTAKGDSSGGYAIRPLEDAHANVNALTGPSHKVANGTYVGLWAWGGGQSNELWFFDPVPPTVSTRVEIEGATRADAATTEPSAIPAGEP
jgi:hypothetical protein